MSLEPEFRRDPVCGRWAVVAPERAYRPITLDGAEPRHRTNGERQPCPFCPGQEYDTPNEVLAHRDPGSLPDGPGWQLRVVPNKFPAVRPDVGEAVCAVEGMVFLTTPGLGRSEVVIECPEHLADPTQLSLDRFAAVFRAYRDRVLMLANDPRLAYAAVFKNVGAEAGASLGHTHSQIIATPVVPELVEAELAGGREFHTRTGRCVFCDLIARELADGERVIARSEHFVAVMAYAPRYAHEFWVLPFNHTSRYETLTDDAAHELASLMKRVLVALDRAQAEPAYNWFLHTAPLRSPELPHYHWHIEVLPRTARPAGLEWGYGCFITTVAPEQAAIELRAAMPVATMQGDAVHHPEHIMRIGIFGGTFDPVHMGHLILAEQCRDQAVLDQVWFMPAAHPPHKGGLAVTRFEQRCDMIELAIAGHPAFKVERIESELPSPSYTANTLAELRKRHASDEFYLLMGSDGLPDMPGWYEPRRVIEQAGLVVVPRPGVMLWTPARLAKALGVEESVVKLRFVACPMIEIASRELRRAMADGMSIRYMVPRAVEEYIRDRKLYATR